MRLTVALVAASAGLHAVLSVPLFHNNILEIDETDIEDVRHNPARGARVDVVEDKHRILCVNGLDEATLLRLGCDRLHRHYEHDQRQHSPNSQRGSGQPAGQQQRQPSRTYTKGEFVLADAKVNDSLNPHNGKPLEEVKVSIADNRVKHPQNGEHKLNNSTSHPPPHTGGRPTPQQPKSTKPGSGHQHVPSDTIIVSEDVFDNGHRQLISNGHQGSARGGSGQSLPAPNHRGGSHDLLRIGVDGSSRGSLVGTNGNQLKVDRVTVKSSLLGGGDRHSSGPARDPGLEVIAPNLLVTRGDDILKVDDAADRTDAYVLSGADRNTKTLVDIQVLAEDLTTR